MTQTSARHASQRIHFEIKRRLLTVQAVFDLTPRMRRITFTCADMGDFKSLSPDDHIKLLFGLEPDGEERMRDYTPRYFDIERGLIVIDFALHEAGVATGWAKGARPGDVLEVMGPRGSVVMPDDYDYYLLIGDETALPAIGRRLEALRPDVPVTAICVVQNAAEVQTFHTRAALNVRWVYRAGTPGDDATRLLSALEAWKAPKGEGYVWIAAEAKVARALKTHMLTERGHPAAWMKSAGYWVGGAAGASAPV